MTYSPSYGASPSPAVDTKHKIQCKAEKPSVLSWVIGSRSQCETLCCLHCQCQALEASTDSKASCHSSCAGCMCFRQCQGEEAHASPATTHGVHWQESSPGPVPALQLSWASMAPLAPGGERILCRHCSPFMGLLSAAPRQLLSFKVLEGQLKC